MAMRAAVFNSTAAITGQRGFRTMYSSFSSYPFTQSQVKVEKPPPAEPSTTLYVSGLHRHTTNDGLKEAFDKFGKIISAKVVKNRWSSVSLCFGFVEYATIEDAAAGIKGTDGKFLDGRVISAEYVRPRPPMPGFIYNMLSPKYQR